MSKPVTRRARQSTTPPRQSTQPTQPTSTKHESIQPRRPVRRVEQARPSVHSVRWSPYAIGGIVVALILIAVFMWQGGQVAGKASTSGGVANAPGGINVTVPTIEGGQYNFAQQAGKPMLLFVSASWCIPCLGEVPKLGQLHNTYKDQGLQVVALDLDTHEGAEAWKGFKVRGGGVDHVWALDPADKITVALGVQSTDTKIIFDRQGKEIFRTVGPTAYDVLDQHVKEALR